MNESRDVEREAARFRDKLGALREEIGRVMVGQRVVIDGVITCMLAGSHALLEGVPGLGKTMLVRTLSKALGLSFARIQFTPDLMPADVIGTTVIDEAQSGGKAFEFRPGPIFANIVLADEINRATPKTQSALLEAMQERSVTVGRKTHELERPHLVLATQNPLEMEGTYPLPEAQLDRFFFKLNVPFPDREELHQILSRTTTEYTAEPKPVLSRQELLDFQALVRKVPVAQHVQDYAVRLLLATRPQAPDAPASVRRFVREGASPRGAQAVLLAAKIRALMSGRFAAALEDVRASALPALRHRVLLNFEGEAEGVKTDTVLEEILKALPES
jgi:MoxR-like ATPase